MHIVGLGKTGLATVYASSGTSESALLVLPAQTTYMAILRKNSSDDDKGDHESTLQIFPALEPDKEGRKKEQQARPMLIASCQHLKCFSIAPTLHNGAATLP